MASLRKISITELSQHSSPSDAWVSINGVIYDVTEFAPKHPGGAQIIHQYIGQDSSQAYNEVHGPSLADRYLGATHKIGVLDEATITEEWKAKQASNVESSTPKSAEDRLPLEAILNTYDFEESAKKTLSAKTWAYISGAANDSITLEKSVDWWRRIWFRPRVLVGVKNVDTSTTILGQRYSVPLFNSPAGLAKLAHEEGECAMARACIAKGTSFIVCNTASYTYREIMDAVPNGSRLFYQLYFNKDRAATEKLVREVASQKPRAICVTVDLPVVGKREADERIKLDAASVAGKMHDQGEYSSDKKGAGLARSTGSFIDPDLTWSDVLWLRKIAPGVPLFVKGIQSAADARKALEFGLEGIYISNHGGRAVDTAQPALLTLLEIQANCPEVLEKMEVLIDGGIRRGTDILKAICLGASGVCLGRPFHYATAYGQDGVERLIDSMPPLPLSSCLFFSLTPTPLPPPFPPAPLPTKSKTH